MKYKLNLYKSLTKRIYNQRKEIKHLRKFKSFKNNTILNKENNTYKKALRNIHLRIESGENPSDKILLDITRNALQLNGIRNFDNKKALEEYKKEKEI